jgi:hypothetical protein
MAQAPQRRGQQQPQQQQGSDAFTFEQFAGVNTAAVRAGVPDEMAYWLDGFMPLAPRQLRIIPGIGPALYTVHDGNTIVLFSFFNIGPIEHAVVFESDGSVWDITLNGAIIVPILPAGSIPSPSLTNIGVSQYGQQYLLIVSTTPNGYWIWDGMVLYAAGSLAPGVTLTNVGAGYVSAPFVTATGGNGSGATFAAQVANGIVTNVNITNPGSGYIATDNTSSVSTVTLVFTGGTQAGSGASLTAALGSAPGGSGGVLTPNFVNVGAPQYQLQSIIISAGGSNYSPFTTLAFNDGNGSWVGPNIPPALAPIITGGSITGVTVFPNSGNPTNLWSSLGSPFPTILISDPGYFSVSSVSIFAAGTGYGPNTKINVSGGGSPIQQATIRPNVVGGSIASVLIKSHGIYGTNTPPTLNVTDSVTVAAGAVSLMPFGISGTVVQTYAGHVWVFNAANYNFTAPGSVSNFATSAGGGSGQSTDNFLKVGYTAAVQTNGFLFLVGDSSMNYISGVTTTGTPPTTTFTNQNSDPEVGSPYPYSVTTLGQDIFLANSAGIFVSSGGGFQKRSEALDGVFGSVSNFGGLQLIAAKATIFGKRVWMVLTPVIDPVNGIPPQFTSAITAVGNNTLHFAAVPSSVIPGMLVTDASEPPAIPPGTTVVSKTATTVVLSNNVTGTFNINVGDQVQFFTQKLLMTNGKQWWASQQDVALTFITTQEINSTFTTWGTDGKIIYPLFTFASAAFTKTAQTKYWDDPGYEMTKTVSRFWSLWQIYNTQGTQFTVTFDAVGLDANNNQFVNSTSLTLNANGALSTVMPTISEAVGQQGILIGMTFTTTAPDMALVSAKLLPDSYQYRG